MAFTTHSRLPDHFREALPQAETMQRTNTCSRRPQHGAEMTAERRLRARVRNLRNQEEFLREEVRQLKAAVHIYKELALRLSAGLPQPARA